MRVDAGATHAAHAGGAATHPEMSRNGVWQMSKLIISYCKWGGSSKGARELIEKELEVVKQKFPTIQVEVKQRSNRHPHVRGEYVNGRHKVVCVRSNTPEQIQQIISELRDQWGTKAKTWNSYRVVTKTPSIQGAWNPFLDLGDNAVHYVPQLPQPVSYPSSSSSSSPSEQKQ